MCVLIKGFEGCASRGRRGVVEGSSRGHQGVVEGSRADPPLDGMALLEVHPLRKVSLDKCSHQGSAHWHHYTLHDAPSHGGVPFSWRRPLRSHGGALTHWWVHQGWYHVVSDGQEDALIMRGVVRYVSRDTHMTVQGMPPTRRVHPHGRAHRARYTDANVHSP